MSKKSDVVSMNIRRLRSDLDWTQFELSERSGISLRAIQEIETGRSIPRSGTISAIAEALNVEEADLFSDPNRLTDEPMTVSELMAYSDILPKLKNIPKDILTLLSKQDEIYFDHLRKTLEGLEERRLQKKNQKKTTA